MATAAQRVRVQKVAGPAPSKPRDPKRDQFETQEEYEDAFMTYMACKLRYNTALKEYRESAHLKYEEAGVERERRVDTALVMECEAKGLSTKGIRDVLLKRLADYDAGHAVVTLALDRVAGPYQQWDAQRDVDKSHGRTTVDVSDQRSRVDASRLLLGLPVDLLRTVIFPRMLPWDVASVGQTCKYLYRPAMDALNVMARTVFQHPHATPLCFGVWWTMARRVTVVSKRSVCKWVLVPPDTLPVHDYINNRKLIPNQVRRVARSSLYYPEYAHTYDIVRAALVRYGTIENALEGARQARLGKELKAQEHLVVLQGGPGRADALNAAAEADPTIGFPLVRLVRVAESAHIVYPTACASMFLTQTTAIGGRSSRVWRDTDRHVLRCSPKMPATILARWKAGIGQSDPRLWTLLQAFHRYLDASGTWDALLATRHVHITQLEIMCKRWMAVAMAFFFPSVSMGPASATTMTTTSPAEPFAILNGPTPASPGVIDAVFQFLQKLVPDATRKRLGLPQWIEANKTNPRERMDQWMHTHVWHSCDEESRPFRVMVPGVPCVLWIFDDDDGGPGTVAGGINIPSFLMAGDLADLVNFVVAEHAPGSPETHPFHWTLLRFSENGRILSDGGTAPHRGSFRLDQRYFSSSINFQDDAEVHRCRVIVLHFVPSTLGFIVTGDDDDEKQDDSKQDRVVVSVGAESDTKRSRHRPREGKK